MCRNKLPGSSAVAVKSDIVLTYDEQLKGSNDKQFWFFHVDEKQSYLEEEKIGKGAQKKGRTVENWSVVVNWLCPSKKLDVYFSERGGLNCWL